MENNTVLPEKIQAKYDDKRFPNSDERWEYEYIHFPNERKLQRRPRSHERLARQLSIFPPQENQRDRDDHAEAARLQGSYYPYN